MDPVIYRTLRRFYPGGKETVGYLRELERTQWLSGDELRSLQFQKIRALLRYAYENVPFYKRLYSGSGIHPNDIKSLEDFQLLPFLTRDDINNHLDSLVSPERRRRAQPDSTGGSTGLPIRFFIDKSFHWRDAALEFRGRGWYGVREGDRIAWVWGAQRDMPTWDWKSKLKARIQNNMYLNAFSMSESKMKAFAEMLLQWRPVMIRAYASALSLFAEYVRDRGYPGIRPKLIETTAEGISHPQRELLETVFQCNVANWYTSREFGTIGFQCPAGGLHIAETRYVEIIAADKPAPPGTLGEVVITSTHQFTMPFIRYKIGDMAISGDTPCSCRRGLRHLPEIVGRLQDFLVTADGYFVHGGYFPHTFRAWPEIARYQVYQPDQSHLEVFLVCRHKDNVSWLNSVSHELQQRFGAAMHIAVHVVDEIKLNPAGKHRFIISEVKPDFVK